MHYFTVLIVDDEPINLIALSNILQERYKVISVIHANQVIDIIAKTKPDIILLDVMMPEINGYDLIKKIKDIEEYNDIPIIFITSLESNVDEEKGLSLGAVDFISKPITKAIVLARVANHLELKHNRDILKDKNKWLEVEVKTRLKENLILQEVSLSTLVGLAETRDSDTGSHIIRTRSYCEVILRWLKPELKNENNITDDAVKLIGKASQLHDIGKIGIPDSILLKPSSLSQEEFEKMKEHSLIGANAISSSINLALNSIEGLKSDYHSSSLEFLEMAKIISEYHHEKWDGSGYPYGLNGNKIPFSARVMAIADVFDALTSKRVYKSPISPIEAIDYINSQSGIHFDPSLLEAFNNARNDILSIFKQYGDSHE